MKLMNKILKNTFISFFVIIYAYIYINIIFNNFNIQNISNLSIIIGMILYLFMMYIIFKFNKNNKISNKIIVPILFILLVIIQLIFVSFMAVNPTWDFGVIYDSVINDVQGISSIYSDIYFYRFDNNIILGVFLKTIYEIFGFFNINNYLIIGIIINIIFIDISILYLYKLSNLCFSKKISNMLLFFSIIFTPFITYTPIFYTDTLSLPFVIGSIYYFYKFYINENSKKINLVICGLLLGIGSVFKFTVMIIFVAIVIFWFIDESKRNLKTVTLNLITIFLVLIIPIIGFNIYKTNKMDQKEVEKYKYPLTHYVMMGLKGKGGYDLKDANYTAGIEGIENKKKAHIKEIKNRLEEHLTKGTLLKHINDKLIYTWGDGTFFAIEKLSRSPKYNTNLSKYIIGEKNSFFIIYSYSQWFVTILFVTIGFIFNKYLDDKKRSLQLLLNISIFGIMLFLIVWECRSRYIVNFAPVFLLSSYLGMSALYNWFKNYKREKQSKNKKN